MELTNELIIILTPVIILQLGLMLFALNDWRKQPEDMPDRMIWLAVIVVLQTFGPVLYFLVGPRVSSEEDWLDMEVEG